MCCAIILIEMWQTLERLQTVVAAQWMGLSRDEKAWAMLLAVPVLYYFGKNSESYLANAISALIGFAIVIYLVLFLFNHP